MIFIITFEIILIHPKIYTLHSIAYKNNLKEKLYPVLFFSVVIFLLTYWFNSFPNFIHLVTDYLFDTKFPFSWNHGFAALLTAVICFNIFKKNSIHFLGNQPLIAITLSVIPALLYFIVGIENELGYNSHIWGALYIFFTFCYNCMEELAWRGFLYDVLGDLNIWFKGIIIGILWSIWHLLIFDDFAQFNGFYVFSLLCILISILMCHLKNKTGSLLIVISFHTILVTQDITVTIILIVLFLSTFIFWNRLKIIKNKNIIED